jgi:hypothetical protein
MTFDGTCERGGVQRAPQGIEESPAASHFPFFLGLRGMGMGRMFWILAQGPAGPRGQINDKPETGNAPKTPGSGGWRLAGSGLRGGSGPGGGGACAFLAGCRAPHLLSDPILVSAA